MSRISILGGRLIDPASNTDAQLDLHIEGAENRIDRAVLEQLRNPMLHLLRNAIDHGIEAASALRSRESWCGVAAPASHPLTTRTAVTVAARTRRHRHFASRSLPQLTTIGRFMTTTASSPPA